MIVPVTREQCSILPGMIVKPYRKVELFTAPNMSIHTVNGTINVRDLTIVLGTVINVFHDSIEGDVRMFMTLIMSGTKIGWLPTNWLRVV